MFKLIFLKPSCNYMTMLLRTLTCFAYKSNSKFLTRLVWHSSTLAFISLCLTISLLFISTKWDFTMCSRNVLYIPTTIASKFYPSYRSYLKSFPLHEEISNSLWLNMTLLHSEFLKNLACTFLLHWSCLIFPSLLHSIIRSCFTYLIWPQQSRVPDTWLTFIYGAPVDWVRIGSEIK